MRATAAVEIRRLRCTSRRCDSDAEACADFAGQVRQLAVNLTMQNSARPPDTP